MAFSKTGAGRDLKKAKSEGVKDFWDRIEEIFGINSGSIFGFIIEN